MAQGTGGIMIPLSVILDGDDAWPDLAEKDVIEAGVLAVAVLPNGMKSGKPSVTIRLELPNGETVLAQTSARLFCTAGRAITAKYPDLFEGE